MSVAAAAPKYSMPHGVVDTARGTWAMRLFILTEAMLFLMLFFAYYYLGHAAQQWPPEPPKLRLALIMLGLLLTSSLVLHAAERAVRAEQFSRARVRVVATMVLGVGFLVLQSMEYAEHLKHLQPTTDAYGSIFYTITSIHGVHVLLGLLMLGYVLMLPVQHMGPAEKPPHHTLKNASLYWHFVDAIWLLIVALIYVMPNVTR